MKKILYITNISDGVSSFSLSALTAAKACGFDFHLAGNFCLAPSTKKLCDDERKYKVKIHQIDFVREPYDPKNVIAYRQLLKLCKREKFDIIHCNTPIGGLTGRLAGKKMGIEPVIYQAHGFHFYKGASKLNWLIYCPIETVLARFTDILITINNEDLRYAQKRMWLRRGGRVEYVPGVGIDLSKYEMPDFDREEKRRSLGLNEDDFALITTGDLIPRKNLLTAVSAVGEAKNKNVHLFICGEGEERGSLESWAEIFGYADRIHFLGFRQDVKELLRASDAFLFTSLQEGLSRSLMEAMASGLACIASNIRGNTDLLGDEGCLCDPNSTEEFAEKIDLLSSRPDLLKANGELNKERIKAFDFDTVVKALEDIYKSL